MYMAWFNYGTPTIAELIISKETEKTLTVSGYNILLGNSWAYVNKRIIKDQVMLSETIAGAAEWLLAEQGKVIDAKTTELEKATMTAAKLERFLNYA